ncbi:MAG: sigma-70 family RNA polymerase sigma factor, partial [Lachnospiraceae bacterium]|nr:sigma-70 family RNA polymerase sigma factor [Lachnospiraceae bacterium]
WRKLSADKRGGGETAVAFEELEECVSGSGSVEDEVERRELTRRINEFIKALPRTERQVFMCRYWYVDPVSDIAKQFGFSESKVKSMLYRTRCRLREKLEKEGY